MAAFVLQRIVVSIQAGSDLRATKFNYQKFAYLCCEIFLIEVQIIKHIRNVRHE